jgi:hypothetical protein
MGPAAASGEAAHGACVRCASVLAEMLFATALRTSVLIGAVCLCGMAQEAPGPESQNESKGLLLRKAPADYPAQAQAGPVTIAAEFKGHSIPTLQEALSTEDFIVVELGLFGAPGAHVMISAENFTLRVNDRKVPFDSRHFGAVLSSVTDPAWEAPGAAGSKSKTKIAGEAAGAPETTETKPPVSLTRTWAQMVQKAVLPEGDRPLPAGGVIFFPYRGRTKGIHSLELTYTGAAGTVTMALRP